MLAFVTLAIVYGSLYPWHFDFTRGHAGALWILLHSWPHRWNRFLVRDAGLNVLIYAPFGGAAFRSLGRRFGPVRAMPAAVLLGAALSIAMELLQVYVPGRDCSILDVIANTTGAAAGAIVLAVWRVQLEPGVPPRRDHAALLVVACWAGFQWFPFFPALGRTALAASIGALVRSPWYQPVEIWATTAEWFGAAILLEAWWPTVQDGWIPAFMAGCFARLLIHGRILTWPEVGGAAIALWLWLVSRKPRRIAIASGMLVVAVLLRELSPFHLTSHPGPFWWIPFAASMSADRQAAFIVLFRKVFDYGALLWLFRRRDVSYWISGPALAALLLGCEWIQRYLPHRTPDITDPVLILILAILLPAVTTRNYKSANSATE